MAKDMRVWLMRRLAEVNREIRDVQAEMESLRAKLENLNGKKELLFELRHHPEFFHGADHEPGKQLAERLRARVGELMEGSERLSPADAVDSMVMRFPGITRQELMERLGQHIDSSSENPEKVISATVSRRLRQGRFVEMGNGRIFPSNAMEVHQDFFGHPEREEED